MTKPLPMGWHETSELPVFPGDEGTPLDEWESVSSPQLARKTIYAWARGARYIRIVECLGQPPKDSKEAKQKHERYGLHIGRLDRPQSDEWKWRSDNINMLHVHARTLMRIGGRK